MLFERAAAFQSCARMWCVPPRCGRNRTFCFPGSNLGRCAGEVTRGRHGTSGRGPAQPSFHLNHHRQVAPRASNMSGFGYSTYALSILHLRCLRICAGPSPRSRVAKSGKRARSASWPWNHPGKKRSSHHTFSAAANPDVWRAFDRPRGRANRRTRTRTIHLRGSAHRQLLRYGGPIVGQFPMWRAFFAANHTNPAASRGRKHSSPPQHCNKQRASPVWRQITEARRAAERPARGIPLLGQYRSAGEGHRAPVFN